jgi:Flp pilus assembly protein TadG
MFRVLRRLRRDERGQAIVIGAVAMLILAVMVMTSVTIGHGVYSKIKLQDAADAQSYSIAVKEARAYNFLAYTNRAMVVHYSAMLTVMSYVSHALYLQKTVGTAARYLKYIPAIGAIFAAVEAAINAWMNVVDTISRVVIPILTYINIGLWVAQEAMLFATVLDIMTTDDSLPLKGTDPKAKHGFVMKQGSLSAILATKNNIDMNQGNAKNFLHVLEDGPFSADSQFAPLPDPTGMGRRARLLKSSNTLKDPNMAKYRLLMGNIANSVRKDWTARGTGPFLIGRRWSLDVCFGVGIKIDKVADSQIKNFAASGSENRRDQLFASDDINMEVLAPCFGPVRKTVFRFEYRIRVAADEEDGFHQAMLRTGRRPRSYGAKSDKHHPWQGITPFALADPSYWSPWNYHFGYPCNVVFITKDMIGSREVFELKTRFMAGKGSGNIEKDGELDMTWDKAGGASFAERTGGMLAMSVGRAIYHRPGDWKEEPNFFNPLWTARLAPVNTHWKGESMAEQVPEWGPLEKTFGPSVFNY